MENCASMTRAECEKIDFTKIGADLRAKCSTTARRLADDRVQGRARTHHREGFFVVGLVVAVQIDS